MSLDELKLKIKDIPISTIVGHYLPLKKQGTSLLALCPFHNDKNPSMHVNDNKGLYMCFACQIGGDAINFVERYKRVDFKDSLREIAKIIGHNYEDYVEKRAESPKYKMGKKILSKAGQLYKKIASVSPKDSPYTQFLHTRQLKPEIAQTFTIGFAHGQNPLSSYLESIKDSKDREMALSTALEIGIIRQDKQNPKSHYDTFRDRIMFPIWDHYGNIVGFGGRSIYPNQKAKYLNSGESFLFNKKNILYGFHLAKSAIREKNSVILVEGYMDLISLHQAGFYHSVAVMGVALGPNSLNTLKNLTQNVYLGLDSDEAGFKAMTRINTQFLEQGIVPKLLDFSPHKDPDDFIKNEGPVILSKRLDESRALTDILIDRIIPSEAPEIFDKKLELLRECFELLSPLKSSLAATERVIQVANRLGLKSDSGQILENYKHFLEEKENKPSYTDRQAPEESSPSFVETLSEEREPPENTETADPQEVSRHEKTLLSELVQHPECLTHDSIGELLDFVESNEVKRYVLRLQSLIYEIDDSEYPSLVKNMLASDEYSFDLREAAGLGLYKYRQSELNEKVLSQLMSDIKRKLQEDKLKSIRDSLKSKQKNCETQEELKEVLNELMSVNKELDALKKIKPNKPLETK